METKRLATFLSIGILSIFLVTSGLSIALRGDTQTQSLPPKTLDDDVSELEDLIGHDEALEIAFNQTNETGWLVEFGLEKDDGNHTYEIEIIAEEKEYEMKIDAYTGEVLEFEAEEYDEDDEEDMPNWEELIGPEEAIDTVFKQVNETGWLIEFELEEDDETFIYELEIITEEEEYEVKIDAYTGKVLGFEAEDDERPDRDRGSGRFWNGTEGTFTSFELMEDGIKNYTLHTNETDLLLFEEVTIENLVIEENESEKVVYEIEGDGTEISIYDVAPALMKMEIDADDTENRTVSFDLGDLEVVGQEGPNLMLEHENRSAKLLSIAKDEGGWKESIDISIANGTVDYTFEEEIFLVFRMTDVEEHEKETERQRNRERKREMEEDISRAISEGKVGGEFIVDRDNGKLSDVSVRYADMQMKTQVRERNRIRVQVSSESLEEGKIVAFRLNKEVMNVDDAEDLEVNFDGKEISMADDFNDLTETSDDAKYLVSIGSEEVQVLVKVPHFSTHTIEIAKTTTGTGTLDLLQNQLPVLIIAMVATIGIVTTALIVKKKR